MNLQHTDKPKMGNRASYAATGASIGSGVAAAIPVGHEAFSLARKVKPLFKSNTYTESMNPSGQDDFEVGGLAAGAGYFALRRRRARLLGALAAAAGAVAVKHKIHYDRIDRTDPNIPVLTKSASRAITPIQEIVAQKF